MTKTRLLWLLPVALAPAACSDGTPVDLGHREAQLADYAASWDGYAEAYTFPAGSSDRVRITLDANGVGTLEVGEAPLDPIPTDPEVGLPTGTGVFHGGFRYPIHATAVEAGRIRFEIDPTERFAAWCAIQTPYANMVRDMSFYACTSIPAGKVYEEIEGCALYDTIMESGNIVTLINPMPVDCMRWGPCMHMICTCTASACAYVPNPYGDRVLVDGALNDDGTSLVGTLLMKEGYRNPGEESPNPELRVTIRLERH
jgi:hypothetical protein